MSDSIEELLREAYSATHELLEQTALSKVVCDGLLISYGPPIQEPDLLLLTFQGGGGCKVEQKTWPDSLLYVDDYLYDGFKFGKVLGRFCKQVGLWDSLKSSTMAFPVVFPQAPPDKAKLWTRNREPYLSWRRHSVCWVKRLTDAIKPKAVIVFGKDTSDALEISWENKEVGPGTRGPIYGEATFRGAPAVYCHHLSRGYQKDEVARCLEYAKGLVLGRRSAK